MRPEKETMVQEITRQLESSRSVLIANYMGLKAQELEEFRNLLKPSGSDCMVVKNAIIARALAKASLPAVDDFLLGPSAVIFGNGDDVVFAKRVVQFAGDHEPLKIKVGILQSNVLSKAQLEHLATLSSREVLIAQVVGSIRAPLVSLVSVLSALERGLVVALNAIREKRESQKAA